MTGTSRRNWLLRTVAGAAALAAEMAWLRAGAGGRGRCQGVSRVRGEVLIGGKPAVQGMEVRPGDVVTVGRRSEAVFVVGRDAFLARSNSRIELSGAAGRSVISGLRIVTGALLSVFEPGGGRRVQTSAATIGIRGTGIYVEVQKMRTYACTCYGEAELVPVDEPREAETVHTTHHDQPRYIYP